MCESLVKKLAGKIIVQKSTWHLGPHQQSDFSLVCQAYKHPVQTGMYNFGEVPWYVVFGKAIYEKTLSSRQ